MLRQVPVTGDDDIQAAFQGLDRQAFPSGTAHDDRASGGFALEQGEVGGEMPGNAPVLPDGAVAVAGGDEGDHTATGARIAGSGL